MDWSKGKDFMHILPEEMMMCVEEAKYSQLQENEKQYALFTDRSSSIVWKHWRRKAVVWSPAQQIADISEKESESRQFAEVKVILLALDVAERESD